MTPFPPLPRRRRVTDQTLPTPDEEDALDDLLTGLTRRADRNNSDPDLARECVRGHSETGGTVAG